jgi:hypothetical protein
VSREIAAAAAAAMASIQATTLTSRVMVSSSWGVGERGGKGGEEGW